VTPIRNALLCLDTNVFLIALNRDIPVSDSRKLLFEGILEVSVLLPLQVRLELQRHLSNAR
jgi:hypothetical protein